MPAKTLSNPSRLLHEHVLAVFARLPAAIGGDSEAVHRLRVAGRRLRQALPVLAQRPEAGRVQRARRGLRRLVRAAALGRDLDVMLQLLEQRLRASTERPDASERSLLRRLRLAHRRSRYQLGEGLLDVELARLRRDLRRIAALGAEPAAACLERLRDSAERRRVELVALLAELQDAFDPERLHAVRIAFRRLRYAADLSEGLLRRKQPEAALLRAQQQQLGTIHDAWVLALWLRAQAQRSTPRGQAALALAAERLAEKLETAARQAHAAWCQDAPALLAERLRFDRDDGPARED